MTLSTQPYKGARDFYPEDKQIQNYMFDRIRKVCEGYGYEEYDAPILEPTELFLSKGNQEIIDEQTYTFLDRGKRSVTIRTEMTPSVSRMVAAKRQELVYPLRWYTIPNMWRYERPQRGRLREFWQLNVDIFGVSGLEAESEIISVANDVMRSFGAKPSMYTILISSRQLTNFLFGAYLGLNETQKDTLIRLVDKYKKLEQESFLGQADAILAPSQRKDGVLKKLVELLGTKSLADLPEAAKQEPSVAKLDKLMAMLFASGIENVSFDITLMRGFDYYTDIVFEVIDNDPDNSRSMFGGGRYDGLVAQFGVETVPTVGFGMGDVTLQNFLTSHGLLPKLSVPIDLYIALIGDEIYQKAQPVLIKLREAGVRIAVDISGRKLDKQIKSAQKKAVENVMFIGENDLDKQQFEIKNIRTGQQATHSVERIISEVLRLRKSFDSSEMG